MKLNLFTANYPYGFGESFLNNEFPILEKEFESIVIYPHEKKGEKQPAFKSSCTIITDENKLKDSLNFSDYMFILRILMIEFVHIKQRFFLLSRARRFASILKKGVQLSKWLKDQDLVPNAVNYSFWMNEWALALAILKKRGASVKFVFRVNGYDIYDERHEGNYLPFRYFIYSQVEKVITNSKTTREDVKRLNQFPEKVDYCYFGTQDIGELAVREDDEFVIFTCSSAIPLKRLEKIAKVVCLLPFKTRWAHHGGGETIPKIKELMNNSPDHITFQYTEKVTDYREVYEIQRKLAPDIFINLSITEGLPVTCVESLSFGVPLLVNDVGSCKELITPNTGILVDSEATPEEISEHLINFKRSNKNGLNRENIKKFWSENFSAEKNYVNLAHKLKETINEH